MKNPKFINETTKKIDRVEYDGEIYKKIGFSSKELKGKGGYFFENPLIIFDIKSEDDQPPSIEEIHRHLNPKQKDSNFNTIEPIKKSEDAKINFNYSDEYLKEKLSNYEKLFSEKDREKEKKIELYTPPGPRMKNNVINLEGISKLDKRKRLKIINNYCFIEEYINYLRPFSGKIIILSDESIYQEGKLINEDPPIKKDPTISSEANIGVKQKLPYWFTNNIGQTDYGMEDVKIYDEGDIVINWEGKEIELNNIELSMYHYLMAAKKILENGMDEKVWFTYKRCIDWFRKNNPKAYMELFD
jgi:hypothetical protein